MERAGWMVFNAFLHRCPLDQQKRLLAHLSHTDLQKLQRLPIPSLEQKGGISSEKLLAKIHPSWIAPYLRSLPENDIRLLLSSLEENQREELKKNLLFSNHFPTLSPLAKKYLRSRLLKQLNPEKKGILPPEWLPENPLNALLELNRAQIEQLIGFLGLHDVVFDLRHIIETAKIRQIENALSPEEQRYLKMLLSQKEVIAFKRMGLDKWDGNAAHLKSLIHQRGLNRLAKALFGQEESLLWHLSHRLEVIEAATFRKFCIDLKNPAATALLARQITELITLIKQQKL